MNRKRKIKDLNYGHAVITAIMSPGIIPAGLRCIHTVISDFFIIQSPFRPARRKAPCVSVDHRLDGNIPFTPDWVDTYMDITRLWIAVFCWVRFRFGRRSVPFIVKHLDGIRRLYKEAAGVYRACQSTTRRPPAPKGNRKFRTIHRWDPHLNCLPSLHVMISAYIGGIMADDMPASFGERDCREEAEYLKGQVLLITESILYVKQHSVNCIPAGLFAVNRLYPETEREYGEGFLSALFNTSEPAVSGLPEVTEYMLESYRHHRKQWNTGEFSTFQDVLIRFLQAWPPASEWLPARETVSVGS